MAAKLANDLMERIIATPHANILSWNGYSEAAGEVKDASDTVFTDSIYAKFSRQVTCEAEYVGTGVPNTANFALITVRVDWDGSEIVTLVSQVNL